DPLSDRARALGGPGSQPSLELLDRGGDEDRDRMCVAALHPHRAFGLELQEGRFARRAEAVDLRVQRAVAVADVVDPLQELAGVDARVEVLAGEKVIVHPVLLTRALRPRR